MTKPTTQRLEELVNLLMKESRELGMALTGAINTANGELIGFDNRVSDKTSEFGHIRSLVRAKGDINDFLLTVSQEDLHFALNKEDDRSGYFTETNPQIFSTIH